MQYKNLYAECIKFYFFRKYFKPLKTELEKKYMSLLKILKVARITFNVNESF